MKDVKVWVSQIGGLFSDATVYVGGLDEKVSEAILWELFLQAGPVGEWRVFTTRC